MKWHHVCHLAIDRHLNVYNFNNIAMRKFILFFGMLAFIACSISVTAQISGGEEPPGEPVKVYFSPDLERVVTASISAFSEDHPTIRIHGTTMKNLAHDAWFSDEVDLALVKEDHLRGLRPGDVRLTVLGREAFIPVMNPANPCLERIRETGITPGEFARAFTSGESVT
jgi:DNA-binding transcriptional LysR family regulator